MRHKFCVEKLLVSRMAVLCFPHYIAYSSKVSIKSGASVVLLRQPFE